MPNQKVIGQLKQVIGKMENAHLKHSRIIGRYTQFITRCIYCNDLNSVSDCAGEKQIRLSRRQLASTHAICGEKFNARQNNAAISKVAEILASNHVASVEVALEEEFFSVRVYTAISRDNGIPHIYRVRLEEEIEGSEKRIVASCNCPAKVNCRHILRVEEFDSKFAARPIRAEVFQNYRAHQYGQKLAA